MATTTLQLTVTQVGDFDGRPRALLSGVAGSILVDVTRECLERGIAAVVPALMPSSSVTVRGAASLVSGFTSLVCTGTISSRNSSRSRALSTDE